jgi:uncharacterized glyoxalase superfamily protein PhnB
MLADEFPEMGIRAPKTIGGTPVTLTLYVANVDEVFTRAVGAGATVLRPLKDQFYGDPPGRSRTRSGTAGVWPPTWKTSPPTRLPSAPQR